MDASNPGIVLSLCQGAWETKLLSVALELELFSRISRGADDVEKISKESGIDIRLLQMMVNSFKALGLIQEKAGRLRNSAEAERYLVQDSGEYVGDFAIIIGRDYYDIWKSFKEVMITGKPVRDDRVVRLSDPRYAEVHMKAVSDISKQPARELAERSGLSGKKSLLEIGGGLGTYSIALKRKNPSLKAVVFDSPFCCEFAERNISSLGIKGITTQGGDYEKGELPSGHDVVMLTHVLQSIEPQKCEALLRKVHEALPSGGVAIVNEFLLEKGGSSPLFSTLFAFNAFMLSNGGSLHTVEDIRGWMENVGFRNVKAIKTSPVIISLVAER